ncbi:MAG: hypothetical protein RR342_01370 [Bacilli bacterium]
MYKLIKDHPKYHFVIKTELDGVPIVGAFYDKREAEKFMFDTHNKRMEHEEQLINKIENKLREM